MSSDTSKPPPSSPRPPPRPRRITTSHASDSLRRDAEYVETRRRFGDGDEVPWLEVPVRIPDGYHDRCPSGLFKVDEHLYDYMIKVRQISPKFFATTNEGGGNIYVMVWDPLGGTDGKGCNVPVARIIMQALKGQVIRYRDGDPFNLRSGNLYVASGASSESEVNAIEKRARGTRRRNIDRLPGTVKKRRKSHSGRT